VKEPKLLWPSGTKRPVLEFASDESSYYGIDYASGWRPECHIIQYNKHNAQCILPIDRGDPAEFGVPFFQVFLFFKHVLDSRDGSKGSIILPRKGFFVFLKNNKLSRKILIMRKLVDEFL
jgi:hypothetical protein